MLGPKTKRFLQAQAQRMHALDEAEGLANHRNIRPDLDEDGQAKRTGMQVLYQNAVNYLGSSAAQKVLFQEQAMLEASLGEDVTTSNIVTFTANYLPLVRRVYKNLFAKSLVSIQPLKAPSGYVFWLSKQYHSTYSPDGITAGDDTADVPGAKAYALSSEKGTIRELDFSLESKLIEAVTQKLAFSWTWESQEKLRSQLGLDLDSEMTSELADELAREQDRYIIDAMLSGVAYNVNWNQNGYLGDDKSTWERREYARTLYSSAIVGANAYVLGRVYRNCDFAIMNATTYALLQKLEEFKLDSAFAQQPSVGVQYMGVLNGWLTVYLDPGMADNKILMGASSIDWKNTGMIFAPFIPIYFSPQYILNSDFTQLKKGVASQWWAGVVGTDKNAVVSPSLVTVSITAS